MLQEKHLHYAHEPRVQSAPQFPGLCKGGISIGGPSQGLESKAFVVPGTGEVGIEADGLIVCLDGLLVLALSSESTAFVAPGLRLDWDLDGSPHHKR